MPESRRMIDLALSSKKFGEEITNKVVDAIVNIASLNDTVFINATSSLSDLVYLMKALDTYQDNFVDTLQLSVITGNGVITNINRLLSQLTTYVVPSLAKINATGAPIAAVFGDDNAFVLTKVVSNLDITYSNTINLYNQSKARIQAGLANGDIIDNANIFQYVSVSDMGSIIGNTTEIDKQMGNLKTIINGFSSVSQTIKSITNAIDSTVQDTRFSFKRSSRNFELTVISEQSKHVLATDEMIASLIKKTADMNVKIQTSPVSNSVNVTLARQLFNENIGFISLHFVYASYLFLTALNEYEIAIKSNASVSAVSTTALIETVKLFVATEIGKKGTTGIKCLQKESSGEKLVKKFVADVIGNATNCLANQTNLVTSTSSKILFKKEDVQLNFLGASEKLCGCLPNPGTFDADSFKSSVECFDKVSLSF